MICILFIAAIVVFSIVERIHPEWIGIAVRSNNVPHILYRRLRAICDSNCKAAWQAYLRHCRCMVSPEYTGSRFGGLREPP
jgi:hypothetical protein